jgi:hypothetical protein
MNQEDARPVLHCTGFGLSDEILMVSNGPRGVQSGCGPVEFIILNNIPEQSKDLCTGRGSFPGISNEEIGVAVLRIISIRE